MMSSFLLPKLLKGQWKMGLFLNYQSIQIKMPHKQGKGRTAGATGQGVTVRATGQGRTTGATEQGKTAKVHWDEDDQ